MIKEDENKYEFGRIVLGLGWPAERPGYLVAVGEELHPMINSKIYPLHFVEEVEKWGFDPLFDRCAEFVKRHGVTEIYGRRDEANMGNLYSWNDRHPGSELDIGMAPHSKDGRITHHVNTLIGRLENRTLHLPKDSIVWGQFEKIKRDQTHLATDAQFPAVAALGYVVAGLDRWPPEPEQEEYFDSDEVDPITGY